MLYMYCRCLESLATFYWTHNQITTLALNNIVLVKFSLQLKKTQANEENI